MSLLRTGRIRCQVFLMVVFALAALAIPGFTQSPAEHPTPLADAVATFNKKADEYLLRIPDGSRPWPMPARLTVDEVVKAIGEWKPDKQIDENTLRIYRKIAETKALPARAELEFSLQWRYEKGQYENRVWWLDLTVMTGANTGHTLRVRDEKLDRRLALRPSQGHSWLINPYTLTPPRLGGYSAGGVVFSVDADEKNSLTIVAAWVPGWAPHNPHQLRFVAFDEKANRFLLAERVIGRHNDLIMSRFRLDANTLPVDKVRYLGIEAMDSEGLMVVSEAAVRRAREKRIEILGLPQIGQRYDVVLTTTQGKVVDSAKLRGKVLLIDCSASWCGPCMKKMPELKRIYDKWRAKGLEVVGLNFDKDVETAETAVKSHEIPWPTVHVPADKEIRDLWDEATRISALPRILVIDQQGILRADLASPDTEKNLENRIAELVQGSSAPPDGTAEKSATNK